MTEYKKQMHKIMKDKGLSPRLVKERLPYFNINTIYGALYGKKTSCECVFNVAQVLEIDVYELMLYRLKCGVKQSSIEKGKILDYLVKNKMIKVLEEE